MITNRDREIINYIYNIGFATIEQISDLFFTKQKTRYDLSRRRLKAILECGTNYIKVIKNTETNQLIYMPYESKIKSVSSHNILIIDYVCKLKKIGCDIKNIEITPNINELIPDALLEIVFDGYKYYQLLEMQLRHEYVDINRFANNDFMDKLLEKTNGTIPTMVIIQNTKKNYSEGNKTQMDVKQLTLEMDDVAKTLIID